MRGLGVSFEVRATDVDESLGGEVDHREAAELLALRKARAADSWLDAETATLTADSVVLLGGELLGKPVDLDEARATLARLCGATHEVRTGFCVSWQTTDGQVRRIHDTASTLVTLQSADAREIERYVAAQPPLDRAGSYGIQDWIGLAKATRLEGSYTNVMGLPTAEVYAALRRAELLTLRT